MAPKKIFFFLPARSVTYFVLCFYAIDCLLVIVNTLFDSWGANYNEFWKENPDVFYISLFIALIGVAIYTTAAISIDCDRHSISLLCMVSAFLLLHTIFSLLRGYLYAYEFFNAEIEKYVSKLPSSDQDSARSAMKETHSSVLISLWALEVMDMFTVPFALLVIEKCIDELREDLDANIKLEKSNFYEFPILNGFQYFIPPGGAQYLLFAVPVPYLSAPRSSAQ